MNQKQTSSKIHCRTALSPTDESIYNSILDAVTDQRLPPGTRLTEIELCSIYATMRRKIERVLVSLETEHVVTIERNRGARSARPTQQEARDIFSLRKLVEGEVTRLLNGNLSDDAQASIRASLERHELWPNASKRPGAHPSFR